MVKKIRLLGNMKLQHDMDISKLFKKIRNFEVWNSLLLNERQKYLLQFNARNLISSSSSNYSSDSIASLFSESPNESDREILIRQTVMSRVNMDFDFRGERCGYKLFSQDLERGVGRATKDSTFDSATIQSSSFVDSENMR